MQYETNKKLKITKHIYDVNISKNMSILNILSDEMFRFNQLLFLGNILKPQKDTNGFQL